MTKKRLIVCCDGTWNEPATRTNVWRIKNAIASRDERHDPSVPQWVYYDPGLGTETLNWLSGGLFGIGLSRNLKQAYSFLVEHYAEGDEIWCFGFSRGAYTVRSLCGMLGVAGLLRNRDITFVDKAYDYYRLPEEDRGDSEFGRLRNDLHLRTKERGLRVRLLGVFDTVGALGVPMPALKAATQLRAVSFHDTKISELIENAYQALAVDERRGPFEPALWTAQPTTIRDRDGGEIAQQICQAWFPGVHSDIGGGYDDKAFADVVLDWMLDVARSLGLVLREDYVASELGRADRLARLHSSMTRGWRIADAIPGIAKARPRPIGNSQRRERGQAQGPNGENRLVPSETEVLHWSLRERLAAGAGELPSDQFPYRPSNVCDADGQLLESVQAAGLRWENRRSVCRLVDEPGTLDGRSARIIDLSRGGARVQLDASASLHGLAPGQVIELVSASAGARTSSIVWQRENDMGIAFAAAA
jgi:uncharacterized protein (DUF2235 family)